MFMHRPESARLERQRRGAVDHSARFTRLGQNIVEDTQGGVRKTAGFSHSWSLTDPVMQRGTAFATF